MLTKLEGEDYIIAKSKFDKFPMRMNKDDLDFYLEKMENCLEEIGDTMMKLYNSEDKSDNNIYNVMNSCLLQHFEEGRNFLLGDIISEFISLRMKLESDDDITPPENLLTLEDIGYKNKAWWYEGCYEKMIEDSRQKEVVEEIWLNHRKPQRRLRTIIWELTDRHTRTSKEITYEELPIDEKLGKIISNTCDGIEADD